MKEEIIWKLVYWDMKMLKKGWLGKPVYVVKLKYGNYRDNKTEIKWVEERFKALKQAFEYLEKAIAQSEKVNL